MAGATNQRTSIWVNKEKKRSNLQKPKEKDKGLNKKPTNLNYIVHQRMI
jgi:hypothetical protein